MQTPHSAAREEAAHLLQPAIQPASAAPDLMVAVDHQAAKIYRIDVTSRSHAELEIRPYDPHHLLHHVIHEDRPHEAGQRTPEEYGFYEQVSRALTPARKIVVVGHGAGKSDAAHHLIEHIRSHHPTTYRRIVHEAVADLSSITPPQLLDVARQALL